MTTRKSKKRNATINAMVDRANGYFRLSAQGQLQQRKAIADFVSACLLSAGCYQGFRYLTADELQPGYLPGIVYDYVGQQHKYPDASRIAYY